MSVGFTAGITTIKRLPMNIRLLPAVLGFVACINSGLSSGIASGLAIGILSVPVYAQTPSEHESLSQQYAELETKVNELRQQHEAGDETMSSAERRNLELKIALAERKLKKAAKKLATLESLNPLPAEAETAGLAEAAEPSAAMTADASAISKAEADAAADQAARRAEAIAQRRGGDETNTETAAEENIVEPASENQDSGGGSEEQREVDAEIERLEKLLQAQKAKAAAMENDKKLTASSNFPGS